MVSIKVENIKIPCLRSLYSQINLLHSIFFFFEGIQRQYLFTRLITSLIGCQLQEAGSWKFRSRRTVSLCNLRNSRCRRVRFYQILQRSKERGLDVSDEISKRFSTDGDAVELKMEAKKQILLGLRPAKWRLSNPRTNNYFNYGLPKSE